MLEQDNELSGAVVGRAAGQQDQDEQSPIAAAEMERRIGLMGRCRVQQWRGIMA